MSGAAAGITVDHVRAHTLSLPDVAELPHFHFTSFRLRGKIFATVPPETDRLHLFLPEPERENALALYPSFVDKLIWGQKVAGIRVWLERAEPAAVEHLITQAWRAKASKSLIVAHAARLTKQDRF